MRSDKQTVARQVLQLLPIDGKQAIDFFDRTGH